MSLIAYVPALAVLVVFALLCWLATGGKLGRLVEGADGRASTSKFQFVLWTAVVLTSYTAIVATRFFINGDFSVEAELPANLLIAMGLSVTTATVAKAITVSYVNSGQVTKIPVSSDTTANSSSDKPAVVSTDPGAWAILQDDNGVPDLSKIQMIIWTVIAVAVYVIRVAQQLSAATGAHPHPPLLPDIEPAFMVLMGLGQGAYLGKKLTTTTTPRLSGLSLASGPPSSTITITGVSLGVTGASTPPGQTEQNGSELTVDGMPIDVAATTWTDTQITFNLPAQRPDGTAWTPGQTINIGVIVGGQMSANTLPFTIAAPSPLARDDGAKDQTAPPVFVPTPN